MNQDGHGQDRLVGAALPRLLALALAAGGLSAAAQAQESLPSVSDYRLPSGQSTPRTRPQGPVDPDNPVVVTPRSAPTASEETPAASPPASDAPARPAPRASTPAAPAATSSAASPRAAQTARPAAAQPGQTATARPGQTTSPGAVPLPLPGPATTTAPASASATDSPPAAPTVSWNIHSAREVIAAQSPGLWPWLAALAFVIGAGLTLLLQNALRRRRALLAEAADADWQAAEAEPAAPAPLIPQRTPAQSPTLADTSPPPAAELDLIDVLAAPAAEPAASAPAGPGVPAAPGSRPALGVLVNPLDVVLAARRMSATLMNAVLSYELIVSNKGSEAIGPVTVGGDMIGAHATLPTRSQLEISGNAIVPLHRLERLAPGESVTLSGEFKLPLAAITPIRSGTAALFVPLARFRVEAERAGAPPLAVNSVFVIGEDQQRPGAALRPFRLDLGPRLYSRIGQRELALSA